MEKKESMTRILPYAAANPHFRSLPLFGDFRGNDNPELIVGLDPAPQVIFKTFPAMGYDPVELQQKTGIPVVVLNYGDLSEYREDFFSSLRIMGQVLDRSARAEAVIDFITSSIQMLEQLTSEAAAPERKTCFVGGIAFKGAHGFLSTQPVYPPFAFINAQNIAGNGSSGSGMSNTVFSKESLVAADPDIIFIDLSTLLMGSGTDGLHELMTDRVYQGLTAVRERKVFGLMPYNWYTQNMGSILADAWYAASILYPDRFPGMNPAEKADEIYQFLLGRPVFDKISQPFSGLVFKQLL